MFLGMINKDVKENRPPLVNKAVEKADFKKANFKYNLFHIG